MSIEKLGIETEVSLSQVRGMLRDRTILKTFNFDYTLIANSFEGFRG